MIFIGNEAVAQTAVFLLVVVVGLSIWSVVSEKIAAKKGGGK